MRFWKKLLVIFVFALTTVAAIKFCASKTGYMHVRSPVGLDPLADYLSTVLTSNDPEPSWHLTPKDTLLDAPDIAGTNAVLVDISSGDILFEKNFFEKRKIASLVKIMTAVVALEHNPTDKVVVISAAADAIGENSMELSEGEEYSVEELVYGLILHSGNDAAYALAEATTGDISKFVAWMNAKACELGLRNTYFADPSGLNDASYSTAEDLVKLTRYALKNPVFKTVVGTVDTELVSDTHKYMYLFNQTNLLTSYPGVAGVKTGYTEEAGLCLVTYATNAGKEVVGVVLDSIDRKGDMVLMLDYGFSQLGVHIEHSFF